MKKINVFLLFLVSTSLIGGCATTGNRGAVNMNNPLTYVKVNFLKENYDEVIRYTRSMGVLDRQSSQLQILYYLGVSQLSKHRYVDARRTFELLKEKDSVGKFRDLADIRISDSYFLDKKYHQALQHYLPLPGKHRNSHYLPYIYYRMVLVSQKVGHFNDAKRYFDILTRDYPDSLESLRLTSVLDPMDFEGYSVQAGSFSNPASARKMQNVLLNKGYIASIRKTTTQNNTHFYRVRINCGSRNEAERIATRLRTEGFATKVYP